MKITSQSAGKGNLYSVNGRELTLQQWGEVLGVKWKTLWARINKGMPPELALAKDIARKKKPRDMSKIIEKVCEGCGKPFLIPQCRDWREQCCSSACKDKVRAEKKAIFIESRSRTCEFCGAGFIVKLSQIKAMQGRFCSFTCSYHGHVGQFAHSAATREKARNTFAEGVRSGRNTRLSGANHPSWTGGPEAASKRRTESGKAAAYAIRYRKANPEKFREASRRRRGLTLNKLPRGTVRRIGDAQRWKCAICRASVKKAYHIDHIMPLKLNGAHAPCNIQILCPTCNVRKSAKHPIKYMQERGFLL
jgi:5-methylcytosine-specific restriction endonuclease McrA